MAQYGRANRAIWDPKVALGGAGRRGMAPTRCCGGANTPPYTRPPFFLPDARATQRRLTPLQGPFLADFAARTVPSNPSDPCHLTRPLRIGTVRTGGNFDCPRRDPSAGWGHAKRFQVKHRELYKAFVAVRQARTWGRKGRGINPGDTAARAPTTSSITRAQRRPGHSTPATPRADTVASVLDHAQRRPGHQPRRHC